VLEIFGHLTLIFSGQVCSIIIGSLLILISFLLYNNLSPFLSFLYLNFFYFSCLYDFNLIVCIFGLFAVIERKPIIVPDEAETNEEPDLRSILARKRKERMMGSLQPLKSRLVQSAFQGIVM